MTTSRGPPSTCRCACTAAFLLVMEAELLASLLLSGLETFSSEIPTAHSVPMTHLYAGLVVFLLVPLVFLPFAALSVLLAAYGRDQMLVSLSLGLQALSWLLILVGLGGYLSLHVWCWSCEPTAPWFYVYTDVLVQLVVTIYLTDSTRRKTSADCK